jgi:hypothetical protein
MNKMIFVVVFLFAGFSLHAGDGDYAVSKIPVDLLKNANVIKRMEIINFEITSDNKAKYYRKVVYTILNENGDRWASFSEGYDKVRSIESLEGSLFDVNGKKLKSLKKGDIKDVSGNDGESLADDNRVKWHSFFYKVYPYTVEYEIEVRYKGTMFLPDWIPQEKETMSVQQSKLTVISPATNPIHFKMFNYKDQPVIGDDKSNKIYAWEIKDIPTAEEEYASPPWHEITTSVYLASEKFVLEDYTGSNASWKDFGKFVFDLKKGRDVLPDYVKQKVHELTDGLSDLNEKVKKLYEYLQQNTRYVSVSLGIGGWQPYDAKYVADKKYGDCKALSNFMYSLLKEAGIRSVYTVIYAGDDHDYLLSELPCSQFNHVILFVPLGKDTTWLECTSQTKSAGYLGGGTANRFALAVDEDGGKLVRTPKYAMNENLQLRNIKAKLEGDGTLTSTIFTKYSGLQQDDIHGLINNLSKDKVKEILNEELDFATYDVNKFDYKENKSLKPVIEEILDVSVNNYATITGKRLFIIPNVMNRSHRKLKADEGRKYDIELSFEYKDIDSVEIDIPKGYEPESLPLPVSIGTNFGKYFSTSKLVDNKILYYRTQEQYSGIFPATDYANLVNYCDAIYKADRNRIVLVKKEGN